MKSRQQQIVFGDVEVDVVRKRMKTIRLKVHPPDGRVSVSAPRFLSDREVRDFISGRIDWIRRKREAVRIRHPQIPNEIETGEVHDVFGEPHVLRVIETTGRRRIESGPDRTLTVSIKAGDSVDTRRKALEQFYRQRLQDELPSLIAQWSPIVGVDVAECRIKRMKTRWGSCNIKARRIWLSLELARRRRECLEFVLVHEMVHLHERLHNKRFYALMDRFMPEWRDYAEELRARGPVD
jgi:predicted metal-dependent hydrolase